MFNDFDPELNTDELRADLLELTSISERFGRKLTTALLDATVKGKNLESVFKSLALSLSRMTLRQALRPVNQAFGELITGFAGPVKPFASGGILNAPTLFPLNRGFGLAGEAGPEAIVPLTRGSDGKLGIETSAANTITVNVNITTPDADSFRQSESQITAMLNRAVTRGTRNL